MEREKRDEKIEEIKVLDKGIRMDKQIGPMFVCCGGPIIVYRG
jgi:hypothetical protein